MTTPRTVLVRGETWVTLDGVAESFACSLAWVREVHAFGLLGEGEAVAGGIAIPPAALDRFATIHRLHVVQGVNLPGIALILDLLEERAR